MGRIVREDVAHQRYLTVFDREVEFDIPGESAPTRINYDIVGHPRSRFQFSVVFPFHPRDALQPAADGDADPGVHAGEQRDGILPPHRIVRPEETRQLRRRRRGRTRGGGETEGRRHDEPAPREDHPGFLESKWCANRFKPFVCVGPESYEGGGGGAAVGDEPPKRDAEEFSITVHRVSLEELAEIMNGGDMTPPSVVTSHMALAHLAKEAML